jgi:hypothetical protein
MPIIDIEENIKQLRQNLEKMTQEMFRMQGVLKTFEGFQQGGLKSIDLPRDPNQTPDAPIKRDELVNMIEEATKE